MLKDDCDSFIEEAEKIVQLFEKGYDVKNMAEHLSKKANLIDPSTVPPDFDPVEVSNLLKICAEPKTPPEKEKNPRRRRHFQCSEDQNNHNNISPEPSSHNSPNSNTLRRVIITIVLIFILCLIFYLQFPTPCPRPLW